MAKIADLFNSLITVDCAFSIQRIEVLSYVLGNVGKLATESNRWKMRNQPLGRYPLDYRNRQAIKDMRLYIV